jgi:hypothetical protein
MALITDPDSLTQGVVTNSATLTDAVWGTPSGQTVTLTSVGSNFPAINANQWFEIRGHPSTQNNGLYEATGTPTTGSITCDKIGAVAPVADVTGRAVTMLGSSTTPKNVMFDTSARLIYLMKINGLSNDGVTMLALHSFMKEEWKNSHENFLISFPFPMIGIDFDAGKWELGVDPSGNANGWRFADDDIVAPTDLFTRRLIRNAGWFERNNLNVILQKYFNVTTLGTFEDAADLAYYAFGNQPVVDSSVDYIFAGPVNEPVLFFDRLADGAINGGTGVAIDTTGGVLTRSDGGDWEADGFIVGGKIVIRDAEQSINNSLAPDSARTAGYKIRALTNGANGTITLGTPADPGTGFSFIDGGGGNDQITRFDGGSWLDEGYFVNGNIQPMD